MSILVREIKVLPSTWLGLMKKTKVLELKLVKTPELLDVEVGGLCD